MIGSCNHLMSINHINRFLQDGASAGIRSLQITIEIKTLPNKVHGTDFREKSYAAALRERLLAI